MIAIRPSKKSRAPMMIIIQPANPIQPAHAVDLDVAVDADVATVAPFVLPACHNVDSAPRRHFLSDRESKGRDGRPLRGRRTVAVRSGCAPALSAMVPAPWPDRHDPDRSCARPAPGRSCGDPRLRAAGAQRHGLTRLSPDRAEGAG